MADHHETMSYIIIGSGIFGASSALHLKKSQPDCRVQLLERTAAPCPAAASHDLNKIVRADYADPFYMKLALESLQEWSSNPIFSPYYKESGILIADDTGWGRQCLENYDLLGHDNKCEIMPIEAAVTRFPVFADTDWDGASQCYWNSASGWAEADKALSSCLVAAYKAGVELIEATVERLLLDNHGACVGAKTTDGIDYSATHVIMCTGAYTPKLLLDTFPHNEESQIGDRMCAAGAISCTASFDSSENEKLNAAPVLINTMPNMLGESFQ